MIDGLQVDAFIVAEDECDDVDQLRHVNDLDDVTLAIEDAGGGVGRITFGRDALVPIMIGVGRILDFHRFQPGIFPRRLIEVTVDAEISFHRPRD